VRPALAAALAAVLALGACGGGDGGGDDGAVGGSSPPETALPEVPEEPRGRHVASRLGCVGCHRIGEVGADSPGPDLTRVGARLQPAGIRRALLEPTRPMPSYDGVPEVDREALVRYLAALR
jgi:menaquinol-cytochrome c reductase cytochrome b/c subunit